MKPGDRTKTSKGPRTVMKDAAKLLSELESTAEVCRGVTTAVHYYGDHKDHLAAMLEAAAKDVRRLLWLEDHCAYVLWETEDEASSPDANVYGPGDSGDYELWATGNDYRDAVDNAMQRATAKKGLK